MSTVLPSRSCSIEVTLCPPPMSRLIYDQRRDGQDLHAPTVFGDRVILQYQLTTKQYPKAPDKLLQHKNEFHKRIERINELNEKCRMGKQDDRGTLAFSKLSKTLDSEIFVFWHKPQIQCCHNVRLARDPDGGVGAASEAHSKEGAKRTRAGR